MHIDVVFERNKHTHVTRKRITAQTNIPNSHLIA